MFAPSNWSNITNIAIKMERRIKKKNHLFFRSNHIPQLKNLWDGTVIPVSESSLEPIQVQV